MKSHWSHIHPLDFLGVLAWTCKQPLYIMALKAWAIVSNAGESAHLMSGNCVPFTVGI